MEFELAEESLDDEDDEVVPAAVVVVAGTVVVEVSAWNAVSCIDGWRSFACEAVDVVEGGTVVVVGRVVVGWGALVVVVLGGRVVVA